MQSYTTVTSHWITDACFASSGYGGNFNNVRLNDGYIDGPNTNWIAWHDHTTADLIGTREYVGDYNNWLGEDDWFYLMITDPSGDLSSRLGIDHKQLQLRQFLRGRASCDLRLGGYGPERPAVGFFPDQEIF